MKIQIEGKDGFYEIKNNSNILQHKINDLGERTGESVIHIITDSIENKHDREKISQTLIKYEIRR